MLFEFLHCDTSWESHINPVFFILCYAQDVNDLLTAIDHVIDKGLADNPLDWSAGALIMKFVYFYFPSFFFFLFFGNLIYLSIFPPISLVPSKFYLF